RHQDNWGVLFTRHGDIPDVRLSPAFDNGTSLGYELRPNRMASLMEDDKRLRAYVDKGLHHMKWKQTDQTRPSHAQMLKLLIKAHPWSRDEILQSLSLDDDSIEEAVIPLTSFVLPVPLSLLRAEFITRL